MYNQTNHTFHFCNFTILLFDWTQPKLFYDQYFLRIFDFENTRAEPQNEILYAQIHSVMVELRLMWHNTSAVHYSMQTHVNENKNKKCIF